MSQRPRASHTCRECRRKKIRCDLIRPVCTKCAASNSTCIYDGTNPGARELHFVQTTFPSSSRQPSASIASGQSSSEEVALSANRLQTLEEKLERLTAQVQALRGQNVKVRSTSDQNENTTGVTQDPGKRIRTIAAATSDVASNESGVGHLISQPGGRLRYVSGAHWAAMCEEASEIEMLLRGQTRYDIVDTQKAIRPSYYGTLLSAPPAWDRSQRVSSKFRQPSPLRIFQIPDRSQADALFDAYVSCFHPVVSLTHIPTLRKEYEQLCDRQDADENGDEIQNLPLILAALYAGAVVCSHPALRDTLPDIDTEQIATELHHEAVNALYLAHFPRVPTVATLAAYLILQGTWMREEEPLTTSSTIGVAVRVAQMLGLHKDPLHFRTTIPPIQAEVQRRVWWHVFRLDVLVAAASGLPPMIDRGGWDTAVVSDLYEDKFGTVEGIQHDMAMRAGTVAREAITSPLVSPMGIWLQGKFQETALLRKLLDQAFHEEKMTIDDLISTRSDLHALRRQLKARSERISIDMSDNTYENNFQFNMWSKIMLTAFGYKDWWFLHTPLFHRSITQAWQELIPNLQLYCCAFLEQYVILCCAPEFIRFQWAWPGNHQPLHALMLVLKETECNPTGPHVELCCSVVDQVMALCAPDGGVTAGGEEIVMERPLTEGGAEAWDFIRRLRARAWMKVGLDPDVILTRSDVLKLVDQKMQSFKDTNGVLELMTPLPSDEPVNVEQSSASQSSTQPGTSLFASPVAGLEPDQGQFDLSTTGMGGLGPTPNFNWEDWDQIFHSGQD